MLGPSAPVVRVVKLPGHDVHDGVAAVTFPPIEKVPAAQAVQPEPPTPGRHTGRAMASGGFDGVRLEAKRLQRWAKVLTCRRVLIGCRTDQEDGSWQT